MQKTMQKLLLILFALLQCLSPLAHAHVDGQNAGNSLHRHGLSVPAQQQASQAGEEEGAVVTMPHACPVSDAFLVSDAAEFFQSVRPSYQTVYLSAGLLHQADVVRSLYDYGIAWSQAPPADYPSV
jgi:hypothetical protein